MIMKDSVQWSAMRHDAQSELLYILAPSPTPEHDLRVAQN